MTCDKNRLAVIIRALAILMPNELVYLIITIQELIVAGILEQSLVHLLRS